MSSLGNFVCILFLIFSVNPMCHGDDVLERIKAVEEVNKNITERVLTLEDENLKKDKIIATLVVQNTELSTHLQSLSQELREAKENWNEAKEDILETTRCVLKKLF